MLGKVMKHEMKATWKVLFPLAMVLVGVTLIGMLMMNMQVFETDMGALVGLAMLLLYIIGLIALSVTAFIFLLVRFYHSMYGAEGYLSHTLPVTTFSLINAFGGGILGCNYDNTCLCFGIFIDRDSWIESG